MQHHSLDVVEDRSWDWRDIVGVYGLAGFILVALECTLMQKQIERGRRRGREGGDTIEMSSIKAFSHHHFALPSSLVL